MKSLFRLAFAIVYSTLLCTTATAQKSYQKGPYFGLGAEIALPVSDKLYPVDYGFGVSAMAEFKVSVPVGITSSFYYAKYKLAKQGGYKQPDIDQVALLLGARYYFNSNFFASGQIGPTALTDEYQEALFSITLSPGVGIKYKALDATLKYMVTRRSYSSLSNISLRVGFAL